MFQRSREQLDGLGLVAELVGVFLEYFSCLVSLMLQRSREQLDGLGMVIGLVLQYIEELLTLFLHLFFPQVLARFELFSKLRILLLQLHLPLLFQC